MKLEARHCPTQYRVEIFEFDDMDLEMIPTYARFATWSFSSISKPDMIKLFRSYQKTPGELAYEYRIQLLSHSKTEENYKILAYKFVDSIETSERALLSSYQRRVKRELVVMRRNFEIPTMTGKAVLGFPPF